MLESRRVPWLDVAIVAFIALNLFFITYMVDLEQLVIADPYHFSYPVWPPRFAVDAVHWWGSTYDPVLMARPAWWKVTIWIDALLFGPFYAAAIYAFVRRRDWIRVPALLWAATMLTNVAVILGEEAFGEHRTPKLAIVLLANAGWVVFPLLVLYRMAREKPFNQSKTVPR
jgi:EXPERA (EXPanded EBP superfamily)